MRGIVSRSKTLMILATAAFLFVFNGAGLAQACPEDNECVTIMHTNDMHSHLLGYGPNGEYTPLSPDGDGTVGGLARIAGKVKEIRADRLEDTAVLLVDAGDFMMGSAFTLLRGEAELKIMDTMGYDVITLGNHEFDWTPASTAGILSNIVTHSLGLQVVASNLVFDDSHPGDNELEALYGDSGVIRPYFIKNVGGVQVGFFGLMGEDADSVAPFAYPVTFGDQVAAALDIVETHLQGVDLIVCLSHSGLDEDSALAAAVADGLQPGNHGIDVIVSGHTHEKTPDTGPIVEGNTLIVQAGGYTRYLGVLDLNLTEGTHAYELVPIDDSIAGDPDIQGLIDDTDGFIDQLTLMGYQLDIAVAETAFPLTATAGEESNLGNLVADSMRWMVDQYETESTVDIAMESNGVIRDNIMACSHDDLTTDTVECDPAKLNGNIAFSDAFRVLPLGFGLELALDGYPAVGYPMVTIYVTAAEIKKALEVITTVYPARGSDFWLNVSGVRFTYLPIPLVGVRDIYLGDSEVPLDTSPANTELYKIAINYYVAQFIAVVGDYTAGLLTVIPKDAGGNSYLDETAHPDGLDEARVDTDPDTDGIQELRQWEGFIDFLGTFPDGGDGIPNIPAMYAGPEGRIEKLCVVATAAYGSPLEEKVGVLRDFRDRILMKNPMGKKFVDFYYAHGEPVAEAVAQSEWLRALVRIMLLPLVGVAKLLLLLV